MDLKEYNYKINGMKFAVKVGDAVDNKVNVEVNGVHYIVELDKTPEVKTTISKPAKRPLKAPVDGSGEKVVATPQPVVSSGYIVKAPLPGTIMGFTVNVGDTVNAGDTVCVLEAMKMENDIHTPKGGKVKEIVVKVGDAVPQDGNIMILE